MKLKKLPIGVSTFKTIINEDYLYVDKTHLALEIIENGQYYFLSRPRRFGKSLFLDTLRTIFDGQKELFKGLYIYDKYEFKRYPIIHISFGGGSYRSMQDFKQRVYEILQNNQQELSVECPKELSISGCLERLIREASRKYDERVVVLVDEYDKPILDNIEQTEIAVEIRDELRDFYGIIKDNDRFIRFVFITGVSKFSKVSLFSGLNNLNDITLNPRYATICGYTQGDIETVFREHLKGQDFEKIRHWYNGYKWLGEAVYNPFDILLFISNEYQYRNYWFSTGTPTFLLKLIEARNYYLPNFENIEKDDELLDSFDVDNIDIETLMWQTGYLTISEVMEGIDGTPLYKLDIPNREVRIALLGSIAEHITKTARLPIIKNNIYKAMIERDLSGLCNHLTSLYASIPYTSFTNNKMYEYEGYYLNVFYAYMKAIGIEIQAEDVTSRGRIDITVKLPDVIYVIEFKLNPKGEEIKESKDTNSALEQIKEKGYHKKYLSSGKEVFIIGIEFDVKERNIGSFKWQGVSIQA